MFGWLKSLKRPRSPAEEPIRQAERQREQFKNWDAMRGAIDTQAATAKKAIDRRMKLLEEHRTYRGVSR